ncbi:hypothetical protein PsYK624_045690 [Phanerochaete sordida]|uniref:Homeobox domain-containing protein n=1 Tax=Phanerochaete sordida TaxID=48140 RepID=A0A9P3G591_9APHY|nr:hypothetical protein PsYK624_045690 [Phanerochaete sordida]
MAPPPAGSHVFVGLYVDSADLESELLRHAPTHSRTTASKAQLVVLETLHVRSRGHAGKEDILLAAEQTGLEAKWIRKWLSRRRCKNKSRTAPAGPLFMPDSPLSDPGSSGSLLPHFDVLLSNTSQGPLPARPDLGRAYSAPVLPSSASHPYHSGLELYLDMEIADGLEPQPVFSRPPISALLARRASAMDPALASLQYPEDASPSTGSIEYSPSSEDGSPASDVHDASPALDYAGIDRLINRLHEVAGAPAPPSALLARPSPLTFAQNSPVLQSGMLSALGLELPGLGADGCFALGLPNLEDPAPVRPPSPDEAPCAVALQMPLAQLAAMTPKFDIARALAGMSGGNSTWRARGLAPDGSPPFTEPNYYVAAARSTLEDVDEEEEESDEDEAVTPDDEDAPMPFARSSRKTSLRRYREADDSGVLVL